MAGKLRVACLGPDERAPPCFSCSSRFQREARQLDIHRRVSILLRRPASLFALRHVANLFFLRDVRAP